VETLGCPKNQVDSDKLAGLLEAEGYWTSPSPELADLVVVNTCAFIEAAREESVGTVLELATSKKPGARLVVTGCMAERYGQQLAEVLPEVDAVAGFGVPVHFSGLAASQAPSFDLLNLPARRAQAPWAYVKVAEGCDRRCGFCAIPSFRGPQRSRSQGDILDEVEAVGAREVILVAQDPVSWGRDASRPSGERGPHGGVELSSGRARASGLAQLVRATRERVDRVRLLYLYPSGLSDELIEAIGESGCPYFDLSLQHVSGRLLRRMRRFGDARRFLCKVADIRGHYPDAALRSSFIVGYPGETEADHDALLAFLGEAQLDWVGFFAFSREEGTYASGLPEQVDPSLVADRISECTELQDAVTARRRSALVGSTFRALVDAPGEARSHREAPEIDGVIRVPRQVPAGTWVDLRIVEADGPDLVGVPAAAA
jgi:ribosomal protein S12 methylthiotransferase